MRTRTWTVALTALAGALLPLGLGAGGGEAPEMFVTSHECMACHNGLAGRDGQDVSIGTDWRAGMMAQAARDPYWQAAVRRETLDHPGAARAIEAECSICHMPMARLAAFAAGGEGSVFAHLPAGRSEAPGAALAADGVSCALCHQLSDEGLGERERMSGRFAFDTRAPFGQRRILGPYDVDAGRSRIMSSASGLAPARAEHLRQAALCASCHTLFTHALGPDGQAQGEFPEQTPYLEWLHSHYPDSHACQACHMPPVPGPAPIASVWGELREGARQHVFLGGNFFVPGLLHALRDELGVEALPQELRLGAERARAHLAGEAARLELAGARDGERLELRVEVRNLAGHKLPSAYPSRRAWLHLVVKDEAGQVVFESGRLEADGSIAGNDNDRDAGLFEPHREQIESPDQVQIYEPILGDAEGRVTTGLLRATRYLKDNRLLPEGFDKARAPAEVAVHGAALEDEDFQAGGDAVRYSLSIPRTAGALRVTVALTYQPIGHRWAHAVGAYPAEEPARFLAAYRAAAASSAAVLASAELRLEAP
jgi:hypothetical protein